MLASPAPVTRPSHPLPAGAGGGKGGGGAARAAVEAPDSLRSRDYVRVLGVLSSGPVFGPTDSAHPLRCLYLDDTPVEASDGTRNFKDLAIFFLPGTVDQSYIPGFQSAESASSVNVQVEAATPWTQTITDTTADAVRITVSLPAIYKQNTSNGDITGTVVTLKIQRKNSGGSFTDILTNSIDGKQRSTYKRSYRIPLPAGTGPWDIRVVRITGDSTSSALQNDTYVDAYSLIYEGKFSYPYSALCGIDINAEQFSRVPLIAADMKGLLVRVPSNYDPETRAYTGAWDGTFSAPTWTNNPAWVFFDLLTHPRYGLGKFIPEASVDKWTLYRIAQYCDELVDDGDGGEEPRFTCNLVLQTRQEALKVMSDLASIFRGLVYFAAGLITPTQDAPADPVAHFTRANVVEGQFLYRGSARRARHTVALVTWNDLEDLGRLKTEYVEDSDAVERYGVRELNLTGFGCTSRGQAHRIGKWALATEQRETDTVVFRASLEAAVVVPGDIIETSDPARAGRGMGGRIHSATTSSVVLDRSVLLEGGETYELSVYPPDGGAPVTRAVTTGAGTVSTLAVSPAFAAAPPAQSVWLLKASNLQPETWRVISVAETDNPLEYEVTALQHDPTKYAFVEQDLVLAPPPTSLLPSAWTCQPPIGPLGFEMVYRTTEVTFEASLEVSWGRSEDPFVRSYAVLVRKDAGNWEHFGDVSAPEIRIPLDSPGDFEFEVVAVNTVGARSSKITGSYTVDFDSIVFDVSGLRVRGAAELNVTGSTADLLTSTGHGLEVNDSFVFTSLTGGAGLAVNTLYYVISSGLTANDFKVSTSRGGSAVDITSTLTAAKGRKTTFTGREVAMEWGVSPPGTWLGPAENDPFFSAFQVTVERYNGSTWDIIRTDLTTDPRYVYTRERMCADFPRASTPAYGTLPHEYGYVTGVGAGAWSYFRFGVAVVNVFGDVGNVSYISPTNRPPAAPTSLASSISGNTGQLTWADPADSDVQLVVIYETVPGGGSVAAVGALPLGAMRFLIAHNTGAGTYSYQALAIDEFFQASALTSSVNITY